jgi:hypothetical protein
MNKDSQRNRQFNPLTSGYPCGMEFFNDIGGDPLKPSLFELVAQEQLRDLLQPALKYVLAVSLQSARITSAYTLQRCSHSDIQDTFFES